jgi:hypothetical protein
MMTRSSGPMLLILRLRKSSRKTPGAAVISQMNRGCSSGGKMRVPRTSGPTSDESATGRLSSRRTRT